MITSRTVNNVIIVMSTFIALRAWLYLQHFAVHGHSRISSWVSVGVAFVIIHIVRKLRASSETNTIATTGLYRLIGHPAYAMWFALDVPLWFLVAITPYSAITGVGLYFALITAAFCEESVLISAYGKDAEDYYRRTLSIHFLLWICGSRMNRT